MGYDDVIAHAGGFGRYQRLVYFLLCLTSISCAFHKLAGVFILAKPEHRCRLPFERPDAARYELPERVRALAYPKDAATGKWEGCVYYNVSYTAAYLGRNEPITVNGTLPCEHFVYDEAERASSAVIEWNMVCGRSFLRATSDAVFMVGVLVGSIAFGQLSDRYGRKPIFFASLVVQVAFGVIAGIAPDFVTYTVARLVVGATTSGVFLVAYVIAMEMVGPAQRLFAGIFLMMFFSFGFMLTAAFAYLVHDWRRLQIALTLPGVLFLAYYWVIPESARWLLSKQRHQAAVANIRRAARYNRVDLSADTVHGLLHDGATKQRSSNGSAGDANSNTTPSVFDLLRHPNLRHKTLLIFFDWFVNSGTYYGLSWNTSNLGGNVLLNFVVSGAVEIPAYTFLLLTLNRWGRRTILCGCMLCAGISLLLTVLVPADVHWALVALAMIGKLSITASYGTIYIFSAEQFPTVVRNVGLGASSMVARIGGILAPFFNMLAEIWTPLPLIIFGAMAFVGGLLSLFLPETHNRPMLETIAEGEAFGRKSFHQPENASELKPLHKGGGEATTTMVGATVMPTNGDCNQQEAGAS